MGKGKGSENPHLDPAIAEVERLIRETKARIKAAHPETKETSPGSSADEGAKDVDTSTVFDPYERYGGPWKKYAEEQLASAQNGLDTDLAALGAAPDGGGGKAWEDIPPESLVALNAVKEKANKQGDKLAADSGVQFEVEPESAPEAEVKLTPPELITSVQDVNIDAKVEPKDGKFDPAWKELGVKYGDTPTGVPQPEILTVSPEKGQKKAKGRSVTPEELDRMRAEAEKALDEKPVATEDVARLMDAVEETRTFYAEALAIDKREQSLFSKVTSIFKTIKRVPDPAIVRAESVYRVQLVKLQEAELNRIKQSGLKGPALKEALAEGLRYFKIDEAQALYDAQTKMQLQAMERTKMGRLSQKIENFFRAYNKLSFTKKLGAAGGWAAAAVVTGGTSVVASRAFASMAMATAWNTAGDSFVQKERTASLEKELEGVLGQPTLKLGDVHPDDNIDEDHIDASMRDLDRADAVSEAGDQTKDRALRLMRIPKSERTPEEQEWLDHQEAQLRERVEKAQELTPEEAYERFTQFAENAIRENTGRIEEWITNDKRRRWGVRVAAVATVVIAGKLAGEFMQSDTGKALSQAIRAKISAGIGHLSDYFAKDIGTLKEYGKGALQYFEEAAKKSAEAELASVGDETVFGKDTTSKISGGKAGEAVAEGMPRGTAGSPPPNLGGGPEEVTAAETPKGANSQATFVKGFRADQTSSTFAREMTSPEGRTPTLDEIVKDLKVSGAAAPETVAPGAVSSKIENILAHTAVKGDTLWDDSIKMAKGLGIEGGNEKTFAAKVEGVIREAIEKDQELLSKIGFSETEFTRSDGEHLWLAEGKPVDYSSILTQEKLQEIVNGLEEAGKVPAVAPEGIGVKPELTVAPETPSSGTGEVSGKGGVVNARPTFDGMDASGESVVANEVSSRDSGKILEMRTVAQAPAPPLEAADIAALKQSLAAEAVANTPATPPISGAPKIGAETILAAKGSGATGSGARFVDAAMENSGSKKPSAGFVKAAAEALTSETLLKEYGPDVFQSQRYISSLPRPQQASFLRELTRVAQEHFSLLNTNVSEADKIQSLRFTQYANMRLTEFLSGYGELEPRDVVGGKASDAIMPDVLKQADDLKKNNLVAFQDLHPEQTRRVGEFVDWCKSRFGLVALPGKKESVAEYMARMVVVSQKTGISIHRVRL